MSTEVGWNIEIPFELPVEEPKIIRPTRRTAVCNQGRRRGDLPTEAPDHAVIRCVGSSEGQPILEVGNGNRWDAVIGAYRHVHSGLLVMVSQGYGYHNICDVLVPQEGKLYFGGFFRPNPERRFSNCAVGRNWMYHRAPHERISLLELANIIKKHAPDGLPMLVQQYLSTDLPEAQR